MLGQGMTNTLPRHTQSMTMHDQCISKAWQCILKACLFKAWPRNTKDRTKKAVLRSPSLRKNTRLYFQKARFFAGLWGEIRSWRDGTTIVQKTHDASQHHVQRDFKSRGILILRNPYEAILSKHNFLYGSHHGKAPITNYDRNGNMEKMLSTN